MVFGISRLLPSERFDEKPAASITCEATFAKEEPRLDVLTDMKPSLTSCVTDTFCITPNNPCPPFAFEHIRFEYRTLNKGDAATDVAVVESLYVGYKDDKSQLKL